MARRLQQQLLSYQMMYGIHLLPLTHVARPPKILEIGLGCTMGYGPGRSARLWRKLLPRSELWEAEVDARCVQRHALSLQREGINVVTGSAADEATVRRWIAASGGEFDVSSTWCVIDDGSHDAVDVFAAFPLLWSALRPGGLYFIEDIGAPEMARVAQVMASWVEAKLRMRPKAQGRDASVDGGMPVDVAFVNAYDNAVVVGKDALAAGRRDRHSQSGRGRWCHD